MPKFVEESESPGGIGARKLLKTQLVSKQRGLWKGMVTEAGRDTAGARTGGSAAARGGKPLIGQFGLISMAMSGVIGSGWLLAGQDAARLAGKWAWLSWVVGAAALGCMALMMVALAVRRPQNGALVRWPIESSGRTVGTIMGAGLIVTFAANMPTEAAAVVRGMCPKAAELCTAQRTLTWSGIGVAAAVMTVVLLINWLGLKVVTKVNIAFAVAKFVIPVVTAITLLCVDFRWNTASSATHHLTTQGGIGNVLKAVTVSGVVFGFTGFQGPIDHAGETDRRHLRRAVLIGLGIPAVIYTVLQVAFLGHISQAAMTANTPYMFMAHGIGQGGLYGLLFVDGMASPFATALVFASFVSAELRTAAEQGVVSPRALASHYGRRDVPRMALIANYSLGMLMLLLLHDWENIVSATGIIALFVYSYTAISYTAFRRTWRRGDGDNEQVSPFTKAYAVLAPLSFTLATVLAYAAGARILGTALAFMFGVAILALVTSSRVVEVHYRLHAVRALWLIGYFALLGGLRLLGSYGPDHHALLPDTVALPLTAVLGLAGYYVGVDQSTRYRHERDRWQYLAERGPA